MFNSFKVVIIIPTYCVHLNVHKRFSKTVSWTHRRSTLWRWNAF